MSLFPTTRMSILNPISDFERLFDTLLYNRYPNSEPMNGSSVLMSPKANVLEFDGGYTIELAIPGFTRSDFSIEINNNVLTVSADLNLNAEDPEVTVKYREYDYSSFARSWTLSDSVSVNMIDAAYSAGILTITVPVESQTVKKLQIEVR